MRSRCFVFGLAVLSAVAGAASPCLAAPFTLYDALSTAYETNPQLAEARAALAALDQGVAQANAGWRPSVNASGSYGVQHGVVDGIAAPFNSNPVIGGVTVTEPIFRGGRTYAEISRAIQQVHAGRAQLMQTEQSVLLSAVTAYMDVVRDAAGLRLNQANVRSLKTELDAVRTELAAGAVTKTDASQAQARYARAQSDAAAAEDQLIASRSAFENVIGRPAETLDEMPPLPRLPSTKDAALSTALSLNPNLVEAKANARAADYAVDDAAGALLPQVSISGQYQYLRDAAGTNIFATKSPQAILSVTGQVTVPIYQGGGDEATVRRAKDLRQQSELAIATAERNVRQDVDSSWQALHSAQFAIVTNQTQVTADQNAVDGVTQEQQAGERSVLDILNAQQELFSAQIAVVVSRHDSVVAAYKVLSAAGQLTARSLGLNVKLYDPREHYDDNSDAWFGFGD
jgi:outer membrane protein